MPKKGILYKGSPEENDNKPIKIDHFCFGIKDFDTQKMVERLTKMGVQIVGTPNESTLRISDPDGIIIQLSTVDYALSQARQQ